MDDLGPDPHRDRPRKLGKRKAEARLDCIALALNAAHEQLSELRRDLKVRESLEAPQLTFPMRRRAPDEREP